MTRLLLTALVACGLVTGTTWAESRITEATEGQLRQWLRAAVEQFRRALAHPFGPLATQEAAEGEVVAQPAVEVLDQRTGANRLSGHFGHGRAQRIISAAELTPQRVLARPSRWGFRREEFDVQHDRDAVIEQVAEQLDHAAQTAVANQHQPEDQLPQPCLGHRQVEEYLLVVAAVRGREGGVGC